MYSKLTCRHIFISGFAKFLFVLFLCMLGLAIQIVARTVYGNEDAGTTSLDDTYVASGKPDTVFGTFNNMWFGSSPGSGFGSLVSVLKFDIPTSPPTGQLDHAELKFYIFDLRGISGSVNLTVKRIAESSVWSERDLTWRTYTSSTFGPEHLIYVPLTVGLNRLDVTPLLQEALMASERTISIAIEYTAPGAQGEAVAILRSKEHTQVDQHPSLVVNYVIPTPTLTPTPTPGTKTISLQNNPTGALLPGSALTYTVIVSNGPYALSNIVVTNSVPGELVILPDTIDDGAMGWQHQTAGQAITWTLNQFSPNTLAQLHYQAALPTPTPTATPTTLAITKTGPQFVAPGELITYTLYVDNQSPYTLTEVTITDTLPAALTLVDPGGALTTTLPAQLVWQEAAPLVSGATLTRNFSGRPVAAVTEVVNADYQVQATIVHGDTQEAISALGALSVTTIVTTTPPDLRVPVIVNTGACVRWQYAVPGEPFQTGIQCSGPTFNPLQAQWLPFVSR